jgi:predicted neuraminidase
VVCSAATGSTPAPRSQDADNGFVYQTAPFPQCHASTIVETTAGTLLTAFFGGTHERHPDVGIWISRLERGAWTAPVEVANGIQQVKTDGTVVRHPTWNPVLFQPRNGPLMLFYKVGPSPQAWWGMLMTSTDDGHTWSEPRRLPEGVLGPIKNKPVELPGNTLLCPSSVEQTRDDGWAVHFESTSDFGRTWTVTSPVADPQQFNAIQPSILRHADGRLQALCRSMKKVITQTWSGDGGRTWSAMTATNLFIPNSGSDAVTLADGRQLLVYNMHDPASDDPKTWGVRYPLNVAVSPDGVNWKMVLTLESEPRKDGYAYPAVIQTRDGRIHITYTWDRQRIKHVVLDPVSLAPVAR